MTTTLTERAQSFGHLFVDRVDKTPRGEAFRYRVGDDWKSLTWSQTKDRVFNLAAGLVDLGVEPQQRVAIAATTRIEWILADLAILIVLTILWLALKSGRIILAVFVSLLIGLSITMALGLAMVGALNLISVAFAVLFIAPGNSCGIPSLLRLMPPL